MPQNGSDSRLADRNIQLLKPSMIARSPTARALAANVTTAQRSEAGQLVGELPVELADWEGATDDPEYIEASKAVTAKARRFPAKLPLTVSTSAVSYTPLIQLHVCGRTLYLQYP